MVLIIMLLAKCKVRFHLQISVSMMVTGLLIILTGWESTTVLVDIQAASIVSKKLFRLIITPFYNKQLSKQKTRQAPTVIHPWIRVEEFWQNLLCLILKVVQLLPSYPWGISLNKEVNIERRLLLAVLSTKFHQPKIRSQLNWTVITVTLKWVLLQKPEKCKFSAMMSTKLLVCQSIEDRFQV